MLNRARREAPAAGLPDSAGHGSLFPVNAAMAIRPGDAALRLACPHSGAKQMRGDEVVARMAGESFCLLIHADQQGSGRCSQDCIQSAFQIGLEHELQMSLGLQRGLRLHGPQPGTS